MTKLATNSNLSQLTEHIRDWRGSDVVVDRTQRTVSNIALTGLESANGYRYSERALRDAISLYENKPVFLDHARNQSRPFERSTRDLVGMIVNPRFERGRVRGNIQTLDTEAGRTFVALAESNSPAVGMSHVVLARRNADNTIVEKIEEVVSVDAVVFPATASTFREQQWRRPIEVRPGSIESVLELIDAALPNHVKEIEARKVERVRRVGLFPKQVVVEVCSTEPGDSEQPLLQTGRYQIDWSLSDGCLVLGESVTPLCDSEPTPACWENATNGTDVETHAHSERVAGLEQQIESLAAQRDELRMELDGYKTRAELEKRRQTAERLIQESRLPGFAVTEHWKRQVADATDETAQRALIEDRTLLLGRLRVRSPASVERHSGSHRQDEDAAVITAVRGARVRGRDQPA